MAQMMGHTSDSGTAFSLYLPIPYDRGLNCIGPDFIRVHVTPEWLDLLQRRGRAVTELQLSSCEVLEEPDYVDTTSSEEILTEWRLVVGNQGAFGFIASVIGRGDMSSDWVSIAALMQATAELKTTATVPAEMTLYADEAFSGYGGALFAGSAMDHGNLVDLVRERFPELAALEAAAVMANHLAQQHAGQALAAAPAGRRHVLRV